MLILLLACAADPVDSVAPYKSDDADADGWTVGAGDCDDTDAEVHPGAAERWYDGVDDDCDGNDDDQDGDGIGFGDGDCNDVDALIFPGAAELCDSVDNDCDGAVDEDTTGGVTAYTDADADGYGDDATAATGCDIPDGAVTVGGDCDDTNAAIHPDADEVCDAVDNDCDGGVDESTVGLWYPDVDGDGFGDDAGVTTACAPGDGFVSTGGDCDDADATVNPAATETCDDVDRNCDGSATSGATDTTRWYADADADGFGADDLVTDACAQPAGTAAIGGDCDDGDALVSPAAVEVCDGVDNDCDLLGEFGAVDGDPAYEDLDNDGYGGAEIGTDCADSPGITLTPGDCDDSDDTVHPGATELCDGIDGDCDGAADDPSITGIAWEDVDEDGYGNGDVELSWTCVPPEGSVLNGDDCDDGDPTISPAAPEICDGLDDDCDGVTDESGATTLAYTDADGDGWGDPATGVDTCTPPADTVPDGTDCDDGDPDVSPGADERCNATDDDCDGLVDNDAVDALTRYPDADGDGYGSDADAYLSCDATDLATGGDCDDTTTRSHPGATEVCDHADNDCDGSTDDESGAGQLDGDTFTDRTATFATATATDPFVVGDQSTYDLVVTDTEIHLCAGTWSMKFVTASGGSHLRVIGSGADLTTVTTNGTTSGTLGSIVAASNSTIDLTDLTLSGGIGSSGTKGGAISATQTTGSATPGTPNITLTGVVVRDNTTDYGGAIAINNYGWVSLVDSVVMDNAADVQGGGVWVQDTGKLSCAASTLGAAGLVGNTAPEGGGVWFDSATHGSLSATGCDFGAGAEDNTSYDIQVKSGSGTCYGDATALTDSVSCAGGVCTASTDTCP